MNKLLIILTAAVLVLTLSEVAAAAEVDKNSQQRQTQQVADPAAGGATASQREWAFLTAIQKCELRNGGEKTRCVNAPRKRYGLM